MAVVETSMPTTCATGQRPAAVVTRDASVAQIDWLTTFSSGSWWPEAGRGSISPAATLSASDSSVSLPSRIAGPERSVPAGVALGLALGELAALDEVGRHEQGPRERVEAADVGMEQVGAIACSGGAAWHRS